MLEITGKPFVQCDGVSRRHFLRAGALGVSGFALADLLRLDAVAGRQSSNKAIIQIHLDGGPPQMDMIDMKPNAPREVRGEFQPIQTSIPGFHVCELMPKLAANAQQYNFLRALVGAAGRHDAFQCQSGFSEKELKSIGGRPAMGCVLTKLLGSTEDTSPTFVDMMQGRPLVRNSARPGHLGPSYRPFRPDMSKMFSRPLEEAMKGELARLGKNHTVEMALNSALTASRLDDRKSLLGQLDRLRRQVDNSGMMDAMDRFEQQAVSILLSGNFAEAMDLSREDPAVVARYTPPPTNVTPSATSETEKSMQKFLLARRLIESGVRCVSISFSDFDTHSGNFTRLRHLLPILDHGLHALVTDLQQRGMFDDVTVVLWGEFGRSPKINANAGRDHWPRVAMGMMTGGGMNVGQVLGATDKTASEAIARPVHYQDVLATMYYNLGIDASKVTIEDTTGRPQYLLDRGRPIDEFV
ncbi:MAG: hypothetical protein ACI9HK_000529 [Pirellulaceae bacterium]|jgi:hypothetical protein